MMPEIRRLFIANRGEIAVRIIRAAHELGIDTIQAYSNADRDSLPVRLAREAVNIGPAQAAKSYLNIPAIIEAALATGADAIHPGYGFLAENAAFAHATEEAGLVFVGPDADTIEAMGDKARARAAAIAAGVPVVPGSDGRIEDVAMAHDVASKIGFPLMIKAAAGGGGRGIRIVRDPADLEREFIQASAEAAAAFGDGGLYLERMIERARHIEVQILGDGHDAIHLFERECSLQRRRQKVWEEGPSIAVPPAVKARLYEAALAIARAIAYRNAGTIEFLYDDETREFYFIEMNTRIQVEHPVTELITGIDIVREMLRIAGGERLSLAQDDVRIRGHAIEVRINAEDPDNGFRPSPGLVASVRVPHSSDVRFDTMLYSGYYIPPFYDSLLGKLIVWGGSRDDALAKLADALDGLEITGVKTTKSLHEKLLAEPDVRRGDFDTRWLEKWSAGQEAVAA